LLNPKEFGGLVIQPDNVASFSVSDRRDVARQLAEREDLLAGRQGFELGASLFSKLVMAPDFWF
jgi:hypothetical protein